MSTVRKTEPSDWAVPIQKLRRFGNTEKKRINNHPTRIFVNHILMFRILYSRNMFYYMLAILLYVLKMLLDIMNAERRKGKCSVFRSEAHPRTQFKGQGELTYNFAEYQCVYLSSIDLSIFSIEKK